MSRIAVAWELGSNFGHLARLVPVAEALRARGHRIEFVIRELHRGQGALAHRKFTMLQAPIWLGSVPPLAPAPSYAGVIRRCGYHAAPVVAALVEAWIGLFDMIEPDLVILDHAPTAALAARCLGVPCLRYGSGWAAPPQVAPLPTVTPWRPTDPRWLWIAESQVLAAVNTVLRDRGRPALARLADLFLLAGDVLATVPEIDHYGPRDGALYWGAVIQSVSADPPDWPAGPGPRIFGFVDAAYAGVDALAADLGGLGTPALLYVRDLAPAKAASMSTPTLRVVTRPVDFAAVSAAADLVINHCNHGTVIGTLLAGKPLLLLPRQAEQRLLAWRVAATGAALDLARPRSGEADHGGAIRRLLDDGAFTDAARGLAARMAKPDAGADICRIADLCQSVLAAAAPPPLPVERVGDAR